MPNKCVRQTLKPDDHRWWFVCNFCEAVWSERILGMGWRPDTCPERSDKFEGIEMSYHPMAEDAD